MAFFHEESDCSDQSPYILRHTTVPCLLASSSISLAYLYEIFSVGLFDKGYTEYYNRTYSKNELQKYINKSLKKSFFKYNVKVDSSDTILSLITCTRFNGDMSKNFKIDAKLVKNKKKGYNYSVQKTENYKEIEKILEGDGDNV